MPLLLLVQRWFIRGLLLALALFAFAMLGMPTSTTTHRLASTQESGDDLQNGWSKVMRRLQAQAAGHSERQRVVGLCNPCLFQTALDAH